ncbi:MAG TPA: hypothetical protein VIG25_20140 [Pyrinomonadaceae bacterium]
MKTIIKLVTLGATVALLAVAAAANSLSGTGTLVQDQCTQENKDAWYATFRETYKTDQQPKAYEAAKKYLTACTDETDITKYLKKWVTAYEKETRKVKLPQLLYNDKNYAEAFKMGKEMLAEDPDNLKVLVDLGYGGYLASSSNNPAFNADAINYARKAIQMIESGKTLDNWHPFPNQNEALAFLNYYIGVTTLPQDPSAALTLLIKAANYDSTLKKSPFTYDKIAAAYENGPYAKQSADYKAKYGGKDETPESKLALENINQIVDRMIDAYARAVALAGNDPKVQAQKKEWNDSLTTWYKYRHKDSVEGLNEMVAGILSKPLPPEPTPLTSLPVSSPAATPASGTGMAAGNGTTGSSTSPATGTASNTSPATNRKPTTPASPTSSTTTTKPGTKRPQRN